ncbi:MAG: endolytic transglycosylase MltG [Firmicutes bacterium]|nr:endolytic transglycosylase MltG [Bacillota bacterium]
MAFAPDYRWWLVSLWAAAALAVALLSPAGPPAGAPQISVTVGPDMTAYGIGRLLESKGLVRNGEVFAWYARLRGIDDRLQAGEYVFHQGLSIPALTAILAEGRSAFFRVTIPEGATLEEVAGYLAGAGLVTREEFLREAASGTFPYDFLSDLPPGPRRLEGYLFPDTYYFTRRDGPHAIVDAMLGRFALEAESLDLPTRAARLGLTVHEVLTVASMVEKEARVAHERPVIAGVIYNRLARGMPLQIDATVIYALGVNRGRVDYKDLEVASPYNTYRVTGLPPGPIGAPGRASLLAAVEPAATPYLYYVARPDGTHAFSITLEEHNRYKREYQGR